jgi:steroid delta-isomerase-like uncharacterized protein
MPDLNKELTLKAIEEIWNTGNFAVLDQTHAPDFIHRGTGLAESTGLEALKQFVTTLRSGFPDARFEVETMVSEADLVATRWRFTGTHLGSWFGVPATGKSVVFTGTSINRVAGGRLAEQVSSDWDVMAMWRHLGLAGDPAAQEAHKALVRRYMKEVWNQGQLDAIDEIFTANSYFIAPNSGEFRGLEARKEFVAAGRAAFPDVHYTVDELLAEGQSVAMRFTFAGTHLGEWQGNAPTGKATTASGSTVFHFEGGKIQDELVQWDALGHMRQLGAIPA